MKTQIGTFKGRKIFLLDNQDEDPRILPFLNKMFSCETGDEFKKSYRFLICESPTGELVATYRYTLGNEIPKSNTEKYYQFSHDYYKFIKPRSMELGRTAADSTADKMALYAILSAGVGPCIYNHMKYDKVVYITGQPTLQDQEWSRDEQVVIYSLFWQSFGSKVAIPYKPAFTEEELTNSYKFSPYHQGGKEQLTKLLLSMGCRKKPVLFYFYADRISRYGIRVGLPTKNSTLAGTEMFLCESVNDFGLSTKKEFFGPAFVQDFKFIQDLEAE